MKNDLNDINYCSNGLKLYYDGNTCLINTLLAEQL